MPISNLKIDLNIGETGALPVLTCSVLFLLPSGYSYHMDVLTLRTLMSTLTLTARESTLVTKVDLRTVRLEVFLIAVDP